MSFKKEKNACKVTNTIFFVSCLQSPCHLPSDDLIYGSGIKLQIVQRPWERQYERFDIQTSNRLRPCALDDEKLDISHGRWVRRPFPGDSICLPLKQDTSKANFNTFRPEYHGNLPPYCWHRDDLTQIGTTCAEPGCKFIVNHRWVTDLHSESKWFGTWEQNRCIYHDMGDSEIQKCVEQKNIGSIATQGRSIKNIIESYLQQKLKNINMTSPVSGARHVVLDTLQFPHRVWHLSKEDFQKDLEVTYPNISTNKQLDHYWVTGFYYTSEREPHVQVDRSLQLSKIAWETLTPRGYKMINGFDVTAAFAYDTDGQNDGMHISGPPIRAIVTKFLHHLCSNES